MCKKKFENHSARQLWKRSSQLWKRSSHFSLYKFQMDCNAFSLIQILRHQYILCSPMRSLILSYLRPLGVHLMFPLTASLFPFFLYLFFWLFSSSLVLLCLFTLRGGGVSVSLEGFMIWATSEREEALVISIGSPVSYDAERIGFLVMHLLT